MCSCASTSGSGGGLGTAASSFGAAPHAVVAVSVAMTLSVAKDYYEARTGRRLLGGEMLTGSERSMAMVGAVLAMAPVVGPSYKALAAASESLATIAEVSKAAKLEARAGSAVAGEIAGLDEAVQGASRVLDSAKKIGLEGAPQVKQLVATIEKSGVKAEKVTESLEAIGKDGRTINPHCLSIRTCFPRQPVLLRNPPSAQISRFFCISVCCGHLD